MQVVENSSLVTVLIREEPFIHLLFFCLVVSVLFLLIDFILITYLLYTGGQGRIKIASASTSSANEPAKDLILVHTVQLKPMIKAYFSGEWYLVV